MNFHYFILPEVELSKQFTPTEIIRLSNTVHVYMVNILVDSSDILGHSPGL